LRRHVLGTFVAVSRHAATRQSPVTKAAAPEQPVGVMNTRILQGWVAAIALAVCTAAGGCAQQQQPPPAPMAAPQAAVSVTHFAGTALSGARPAAGAVAATPAVRVDVEWLAVERDPLVDQRDGALLPLGSAARLVLATRDRQPVLSTSRLTSTARYATGDAAASFVASMAKGQWGQTASMLKQQSALPPDVTLDVRAVPAGTAAASTSTDIAVPVVEIFLQHVPAVGGGAAAMVAKPPATAPVRGAIELALAVQDYAAPIQDQPEPAMNAPAEPKQAKGKRDGKQPKTPPQPQPPPETPPQNVLTREIAVLPPLKLTGAEQLIVLAMPSNFIGSPAKGLVAVVRVAPAADDPATQKLIAATIADVRRQGDLATGKGAASATSQPAVWPGYESALTTLDRADVRRRALVYLTGQTNAKLCGDVALVADDATLQQLAADARASAAAAKPPYTPEALGWLLDRACLAWCARLSGENRLPPELAAVLSTYAGEAGRRPASLEEMLRAANSRASLDARLVSENLIYLEDSSPSARVRANDWLAARGRAPAGYDPLGPPRARREALERALDAAAASGAATQPTASSSVPPPPPSAAK
jgi:hypothetical protein